MEKSAVQSCSIEVLPPRWQKPGLLLLGMADDAALIQQIDEAAAHKNLAGVALPGLLGMWDAHGLWGVVWAQLQPGGTTTIWPPRVVGHHEGLGARLAVAAVEVAEAHGARIAQALLSPSDIVEAKWLEEAGLQRAAEIQWLVWDGPSSPPLQAIPDPLRPPWRAERYEHARHRVRMEKLLERTFVDSLDCPALEGVRPATDVLEGYLAAGASGSEHWYFIHDGAGDAGCLLLSKDAAANELELVYMGLTPQWRGRGLGKVLVQLAQSLTCRAGCHRLLTAVDAANVPACATYGTAGFHCWDRRHALWRVFK